MKIGIIGCGYVGQAVASFWKSKGFSISVTTRNPQRLMELKKIANEVFLLKDGNLIDFLTSQDVILISVAPDSRSDYKSTYLKTAQQVVEQLPYLPLLKQILYTSSTSVYGDHQGAWVDEETPIFPPNEQAKVLYETENLLHHQASNILKVCIIRLGEIYGPQRQIEDRLRRMQGHFFPGDGQSYTNLIHLDDIVQALDFALQHQLSGIYNLCNDNHLLRKDFYTILSEKAGLPPVQWNPNITSMHSGNKRVSTQKLKKLGFLPLKNN